MACSMSARTPWLAIFKRSLQRRTELSPGKDEKRRRQMYTKALQYARQEEYDRAGVQFEVLLGTYPSMCKAWVSYAQVGVSASTMLRNSRLLVSDVARQM
jgi:hypothetical protein